MSYFRVLKNKNRRCLLLLVCTITCYNTSHVQGTHIILALELNAAIIWRLLKCCVVSSGTWLCTYLVNPLHLKYLPADVTPSFKLDDTRDLGPSLLILVTLLSQIALWTFRRSSARINLSRFLVGARFRLISAVSRVASLVSGVLFRPPVPRPLGEQPSCQWFLLTARIFTLQHVCWTPLHDTQVRCPFSVLVLLPSTFSFKLSVFSSCTRWR
jgi:hypothetical protein